MDSTNVKETEKHCVLCCQEIDIFAFGKCDHPVCYRCSTKMRVLCEQKYCAVCREELDKVVFVKSAQAFSSLPHHQFPCEKTHDIYFGDEMIYAQYRHLLLSQCPCCSEAKVFSRFVELEQHMRKQHELFCCKLCTKHLKIFSHERKWYNRKELARHRAHGDPDDTSHRGHPLCKFCDDRYLDNDELLKHLRKDHYFCHFCDADGSQEYYSDYQYLSEHFRESHYLCEEGLCATEQFTHAFRTEIDYKAHKASAHSKSRAEARQNRHIDLQFSLAPRQQRRNEGTVTGEDYEEARHQRGGRGRLQMGQKSWRYSREDEDREVAAAMRASMVMRRQEDRMAALERSAPKHYREERTDRTESEEQSPRTGPIKPTTKPPVRTMRSLNPTEDDDFPVLGAAAPPAIMKSCPPVVPPAPRSLQEDDFPSLSVVKVTAPMTPSYPAQPKKSSSFQEEDFPALVSKIHPVKSATGKNSAWSTHTAPAQSKAQPPPSVRPPPPLSAEFSSPQILTSSTSSSSRRKKKVGESGKEAPARLPISSSDDESGGMTQQEFRSVPTMLDISSLLTVKGSDSKTSTATSKPSTLSPSASLTTTKASKKKKQKNATAPSNSTSGTPAFAKTLSVETAAQKENVPEKTRNKSSSSAPVTAPSRLINGFNEKTVVGKEAVTAPLQANTDALAEPEEDFPALKTKKPPPGFKSSFPIKSSTAAPSSPMPPPPPGLGLSATKPPPGFTGIPLNSNVVETPPLAVNLLPKTSDCGYLVPEDFNQRNLELIQSIRKYLHDDESKFNQFKNYSAQFRQGVLSAAQYHSSCKDLLGEDFNRIFNELLVLLPDTVKQQELLTAHGDCKAKEKQSGTGGGKKNKNKKNAWQAASTQANANAAELDCQVCPTCRQVLAPKDFNSHKTLHMRENDEFPSLQSISRIIS
ncbi:E3 ubiquitin-protein ligase ZNF598 [Corythoichthys intestinalis]|uniref:E3 ubiquitin-protein ligase ZNF598 n=1 Tax=Corythoichthys intestinalis TaxID=161448 RepID=UPI0025A64C0A|nr:E3 ubiquitin-protein ligase ZNF598 [Corythoichthys intestinalis]XP_061805418.1 E3 ubiquitin-protein ligase ZNF598-like [Nerophis lumbriciformis]